MIQYFFDSLMGCILLSGLMICLVGCIWVLLIALNELLETLGVERWKNYGLSALTKRRLRSGR